MAKQTGILPIEGSIDNLTFFKSKDGYLVRKRGGIPAAKIATDPAFQRTRENNAEFSRAGKAARLLRIAMREALIKSKDARVNSRLTAKMVKVIREDSTNPRGQRNVIDGEAVLLSGFEFNLRGKLSATLFAAYAASVDRATGEMKITVQPFSPLNLVTAPQSTTHFQLFMGAAAIDFEAETFNSAVTTSGYLAYTSAEIALTTLTVNLPVDSTHPLFLALGIEFLQEVNGEKYSLKNGAFNACALVNVDVPA